jgi:hypothetical protein
LAYPTIYSVTYSYTGFQQSQGNSSFPGTQIDADIQGLRASLNSWALFSENVIRADGLLNNGIVGYDALSPALQTAGLSPASAWLTGTAYLANVNAVINNSLYRCLIPHMAGVFATDLAAGKWVLVTALQAGAGYGGTSTASMTIGTGAQTFATQAGLAYQAGARVRLSSGAAYMEGTITAYSFATGSMTVNFVRTSGAGTFATWAINPAGDPGAGDMLSANNLADVVNAATARANLAVPGLAGANSYTGAALYTVGNAGAMVVGPNGATNPTWQVNTSAASAATGLLLQAAAAGGGVSLSALSSGANESLYINAKGTGKIIFANLGGGIFVGSNAPSADDSAVLVGRGLSPGSGLLNSHGFRDETVATQNVTAGGFSGYAAFDMNTQVQGICTTPMNHIRAFQARPAYNCTGTVNEVAGLWVGHTSQAGTVAGLYGVKVVTANIVGGNIVNQYAFYADTLSGAAGNYFLFGGNNPSVLNGNLYVGGRTNQMSVELANIRFAGASQFGLLFDDTTAAAGSGTAINFFRNNSSVGTISTTLTATAYNTSSDERLKNFLGDYDPKEAIRVIRADPVREFTWKATGSRAVGWGAQTSFAVSIDLATPGDNDMMKTPGDEGYEQWGIDQGKRTPYLWAAMADVLNRLDAIEGRRA